MDGTLALNTIESFKEIMTPEDFDEFLKSEDSAKLRAFPEVQGFLKADKKEEPPSKDTEEKEPEEEEEEQGGDEEELEKEKKPEKEEKSLQADLIKGISEEISSQFKGLTELIQKAVDLGSEVTELKKSVDEIKGVVEKVAAMPLGTKALRAGAAAQFLEKALGGSLEDGEEKQVLSINSNKEAVLKAMETGLSKATDDELKRSYEDSIVRYNAGGGQPSREVAQDLFEKHNIRLTK